MDDALRSVTSHLIYDELLDAWYGLSLLGNIYTKVGRASAWLKYAETIYLH